jgi:integrase
MSVCDRWHKSHPGRSDAPCKEHSRGRTKLYPAAEHGQGDRWQVRWRDENKKQFKRNFPKRDGTDPEKCASAFDAKVKATLDDGSYVDPHDANTTFQEFAEDWRKTRPYDLVRAVRVERLFRLHVHAAPHTPGRTPTGAPALGHRTLKELGRRPSITQAWISGMKLGDGSKGQVITLVSSVFIAAIDDGLMSRNPTRAQSVTRPKPDRKKARPWTLDQVEAMSAALPPRYALLPYLGAGTGMRQAEMFGLAMDDIEFLSRRPFIHVRRQVRVVVGVACFAPIKNRKEHDVPLAESLCPILAEHIRLHPPVVVTLPWRRPDGDPVSFKLIVTRPDGRPWKGPGFDQANWYPAQEKAGIMPRRRQGEKRKPARDQGMHVLRHTAASAWLSAGADIVAVAAWLGDTVETVHRTYAHLMPDADDRGRKAMDQFFRRADDKGSALNVPSDGAE